MAADREPVPGTMADPIPDQPGDPSLTAPNDPAQQPGPAQRPAPGQAVPKPATPGQPLPPDHALQRTRLSGVWAAVGCFTVILVLLLIFILQNSRTVEVSYFGAHGHLPLGVALLLAAVAGVFLIVLPGAARIIQLRRTARRHRHADNRHVTSAQSTTPAGPGT